MSPESRKMATLMFRAPVETFAGEAWPKSRFADLRKFCVQTLERHLERKLKTAAVLDRVIG
jgi:DNA repair protein RecO (recombination protein O)